MDMQKDQLEPPKKQLDTSLFKKNVQPNRMNNSTNLQQHITQAPVSMDFKKKAYCLDIPNLSLQIYNNSGL
jgi:hypothetical protein